MSRHDHVPGGGYGEEVRAALADPRDLVVYFGHGRPGAWLGYVDLDAESLAAVDPADPHRLVAGLCCHALDGEGDGDLPRTFLGNGLAHCFVGYRRRVEHEDNQENLDALLGAYRDALAADEDGVRAVVERARRTPDLETLGAPAERPA
ncbi:hypothetical protein BRC81_11445 [Halobacteriales archaeon QS_1_68_20]|nr:MAG: hypothetical protein BRC81_11445 [Halobacteriales archaeon QS_1_68_20]